MLSFLIVHTRINSKWITDLNVRPEIIKRVGENIGSKVSDIARSNILSDISPQAKKTKEKINKWDYVKLKCLCTAKQNINKIQRQWEDGRTYSPIHLIRGWDPKCIKNLPVVFIAILLFLKFVHVWSGRYWSVGPSCSSVSSCAVNRAQLTLFAVLSPSNGHDCVPMSSMHFGCYYCVITFHKNGSLIQK